MGKKLKERKPPKQGGLPVHIRGIPWRIFKVRDLTDKLGIDGYCLPRNRVIAIDSVVWLDPIEASTSLWHELAHAWLGGALEVIEHKDEESIVELVGQGITAFLLEHPNWKERIGKLPVIPLDKLMEVTEDSKDDD